MASSTADLEASAGIIGHQRWQANVLVLFQQLLSAEFVSAVLREAKVRENNRVYTSPVVMWLMVWQRLQAQGTLESAVVELLRGLPSSFWPHPCKRLTEAVEEGGLAGRTLLTFARASDRELGGSQIGVGSIVRVGLRREQRDDAPTGVVARRQRSRVAVVFDEPPPSFVGAGRVVLELQASSATHDRLSGALRRMSPMK